MDKLIILNENLNALFKQNDLQKQYDKSLTHITANNFNIVVSSLIYAKDNIDITYNAVGDLYNQISQLNTKIDNINGSDKVIRANELAHPLNFVIETGNTITYNGSQSFTINKILSSVYSNSANTVNKLNNSLNIKYDKNNIRTFDGSIELSLSSICSSYYSYESVQTNKLRNSLKIKTSQNGYTEFDGSRAQTIDKVYQSLSAGIAELTNESECANRVKNKLYIVYGDDTGGKSISYDGSDVVYLSSVFYSTSSYLAQNATYASNAYYDMDGNILNTKVEYIAQDNNLDKPILFSYPSVNNVETNSLYQVGYNQQVLINPYTGSIKANYFLGTATSASYAVCDAEKKLINTCVSQNETENSYNYPILLAYVGNTGEAANGGRNQVFYNSSITINPSTKTLTTDNIVINSSITVPSITIGSTSINDGSISTQSITVTNSITVGSSKISSTEISATTIKASDIISASVGFKGGTYTGTYYYGTEFCSVSTKARWADLAQMYQTDYNYPIGTLVMFGGQKEITIANKKVNAVVSQKPAVLMNSELTQNATPIALTGRVKVRIIGKINKFDYIKLSNVNGIGCSVGTVYNNDIIGIALQNNLKQEQKLVQCCVQLHL